MPKSIKTGASPSKPRSSKSSPRKQQVKDPFASREAENYDNPIPSREFILEHLEEAGEPLDHETLCRRLSLVSDEQVEALRRRLIAMSRDGQLISNRRGMYGLASSMELIKGRIQGNKDGFGFFIPEDGSEDLFLGAREMETLFDGDKVLARVSGVDNRGRKEGTIVEVLQRRFTQIVGRYYHEQGFGVVVPDSKRVSHEILIPDQNAGNAKDGEFVVAEIVEYPTRRRKAIARIAEVLGDSSTPGLEIDVALRSHDIPHEWPDAVEKQTRGFADEVREADLAGRKDMRDVPFVTIDGEDAKDFDDAVYAREHKRGNWTLYVAIADVSHYVQPKSALDEEAINRATSVYFPGFVVPMLPEKLSNGLCSLKPAVDRLTMVCEMEISPLGEMTAYKFYEAVIHSHGRLTYNEVADIVQPAETAIQQRVQAKQKQRYAELVPHLTSLYGLYHALRETREADGAMDFDTTETRIVFGENRKIAEIVPVYRNDAHKLIEECMLRANVAAALLLESAELPALYRVHQGPNPDKLENLKEFLREMGLHMGGGLEPTPRDYQAVLKKIANRPDHHLLQTMLIRSMMQAVYQPDNIGHFGLGFEAYTHFTSPIRRYPDLLVHRGIRHLIRNSKHKCVERQPDAAKLAKAKIYPYGAEDMLRFGEHASTAERRADAAGYSVVDWLKCEYMQDKIGDEFPATVTSVTSFGLFVELNDIFVEGLVHITELSNDYYRFDPVRHCLEGERSRKVYRLGDSVEVRVVRVDLDEKKIDLQMLGAGGERGRPEGKSSRPGGKQASGKKPGDKRSNDKRTGDKKPSDKKPRGKKPAGKKQGGNKPAAKTAESSSGAKAPAAKRRSRSRAKPK
ncbi:MAG: ribonuclease R [Gammaproteobacteria bacterium]|jgi:ribonuclease R|nr:ribonuclease R [Gammaproteobacteria bacterium]